MNRKSLNRWIVLNAAIIFLVLPLALISFQNCAPKTFSTASDESVFGNPGSGTATGSPGTATAATGPGPGTSTGTPTPDGFMLQDQVVKTSFNTPVTFNAITTGDRSNYTYSFDIASNLASKNVTNVGLVEVIDAAAWQIRFTPVFGFRGELQMWVFGRKADGTVSQARLTLQVGNTVNLLAPALAVRATGCITCHAEVHSNIITDFGYGGDGNGRNYYFGNNPPTDFAWNDGLAYGDQNAFFQYDDGSVGDGSWWHLNLAKNSDGTGQKVYVPAAALPGGPAGKTGASSLRGYLQHRMNASEYAGSHSATAIEKGTVFIGAPTAARMQTVFNWNGSDEAVKYKYIADANGAAFSGITLTNGLGGNKYFTNTGTVVCEGDLLLKGTVYLNNLSIQTHNGCRIYSTGSVFIYGPITYVQSGGGDFSKRNLQISSAKAVMMGLGYLWKNGNHCEQGGQDSGYWGYYDNRDMWTTGMSAGEKAEYLDSIADSAKFRLKYFWGLPGFYLRNDSRAGVTINTEIFNELYNVVGAQQDAACRPEGRGVYYERLLLNAPLVESRYTGGFKGSIIAEIGLMGLGLNQGQPRFKFEFDPVFQNADVFPLLTDQDFLLVQ